MAEFLAQEEQAEEGGTRDVKTMAKAIVSPAPLIGSWHACNKDSSGIVHVRLIDAGAGNLEVQVFGACTPSPCKWGSVNGIAYADSVSASPAVAFSAAYVFSFKRTIVTGHLEGGRLIVETFNVFTDGSGRSSYYSREALCKE